MRKPITESSWFYFILTVLGTIGIILLEWIR